MVQTRRGLIKKAAKMPTVTLGKLKRSTGQDKESTHRTSISNVTHKSDLVKEYLELIVKRVDIEQVDPVEKPVRNFKRLVIGVEV